MHFFSCTRGGVHLAESGRRVACDPLPVKVQATIQNQRFLVSLNYVFLSSSVRMCFFPSIL